MISRVVDKKEQGRALGNNLSLQFFSEAFVGIVIGFLAPFYLRLTIVLFGTLSIFGALFLTGIGQKKPLR